MMEASLNTELHAALEMMEMCLETPLVAGELESWVESLQAACGKALEQWNRASQVDHPAQFNQMTREDPEMDSRIQSLQEEDMAITGQFDAMCQDVATLQERAPTMEEDEGRFKSVIDDQKQAGLNLVIRIRSQEQAIRTWFMEAFDRDRGSGD
jgi:hypothetical protein